MRSSPTRGVEGGLMLFLPVQVQRTCPLPTFHCPLPVQVQRTYPLVQAGGEDVITVLTTISHKIWQTGDWPTPWTRSSFITLPKKDNLQQCQNYSPISLISHPRKVMLKVILNRLKPKAKKIIAEGQVGFRAGRSTTEHIFNLRIL